MSHIRQFEHLKITLEAIKSATNNFADGNYVGRGGFGKVYKGKIVHSEGQSMVAIKRLDREFGQGNREFWKEITMLSLYKHENLVHLLGFCDESDEKILVYEFVSNKGLDFHLNNNDLTWTQRLKICIEMARGLAYLHNSGTELRVIHRDIKSSNILLDENWNAKISDFGLAKLAPASNYTFVYTSVVGTPGYVDPLYKETGLLTKESDVYSLGVVLFEVLCGRLCNKGDQPLTKLARQYYKLNKVDTIVFCNIRDEMNPNSLLAFTKLAYGCSNREREERPSITEVVSTLETALRYQAIVSPSSGWMATANSSMPHASVAAGPPGLVQPPVAAAVLKDPQTPSSDPGLEYEAGPSDEEFFSASSYPPNAYSSNDLPKTAVRLLKQGSNVMSMDFHPQRQTTLLVGTNVGEIRIWEVGIQERMVHKPFKVWDISACSMPFRQLWQKMQQYLLNGAHGEQMDQYLIDAHVGSVNDIAFALPDMQPCIVTCGDDMKIKVWDFVDGRMQYVLKGHEAPVYSLCPHHEEQMPFIFSTAVDGKIKAWISHSLRSKLDWDAPGHWCTTMAYSTDGTRLFSCGTRKRSETQLVEWNVINGAIKREYSGLRKKFMGVIHFDTVRNRFLAAGDGFHIKFWDMDSIQVLKHTYADARLPASPRLRFNKGHCWQSPQATTEL